MLVCHTRPKNVKYEGRSGSVWSKLSHFASRIYLHMHGRELAWRQLQTSKYALSHRNIEESTVLRPQEVEAMQPQLL